MIRRPWRKITAAGLRRSPIIRVRGFYEAATGYVQWMSRTSNCIVWKLSQLERTFQQAFDHLNIFSKRFDTLPLRIITEEPNHTYLLKKKP